MKKRINIFTYWLDQDNDRIGHDKKIIYEKSFHLVKWCVIFLTSLVIGLFLMNRYNKLDVFYPTMFSFLVVIIRVILLLYHIKIVKKKRYNKYTSYYVPVMSNKGYIMMHMFIFAFSFFFMIYSIVGFYIYKETTAYPLTKVENTSTYVLQYEIDSNKYYLEYDSDKVLNKEDGILVVYKRSHPIDYYVYKGEFINLRILPFLLTIYSSFGIYLYSLKYIDEKRRDLDKFEDFI
jgi:hypothetical protein